MGSSTEPRGTVAQGAGNYSNSLEAGAQFPKNLGNRGGAGSFCRKYSVGVYDQVLILVDVVGVPAVVCLKSCKSQLRGSSPCHGLGPSSAPLLLWSTSSTLNISIWKLDP